MSLPTQPDLIAKLSSGAMSVADYQDEMARRSRQHELAYRERVISQVPTLSAPQKMAETELARSSVERLQREADARAAERRRQEAAAERLAAQQREVDRARATAEHARKQAELEAARQKEAVRRAESERRLRDEAEAAERAREEAAGQATLREAQTTLEAAANGVDPESPEDEDIAKTIRYENLQNAPDEHDAAAAALLGEYGIATTTEVVEAPPGAWDSIAAAYRKAAEQGAPISAEEWYGARADWFLAFLAAGQPIPEAMATEFIEDVQAGRFAAVTEPETTPSNGGESGSDDGDQGGADGGEEGGEEGGVGSDYWPYVPPVDPGTKRPEEDGGTEGEEAPGITEGEGVLSELLTPGRLLLLTALGLITGVWLLAD